jgi:SOS-response transcriptional repressor LexA
MKKIGERVKYAREKIGMSQTALAEAVGIRQPTISDLEKGGNQGTKKLNAIAKVLGVNLDWLEYGGTLESQPVPQAPNVTPVELYPRIPLINSVQAGGWGQLIDLSQIEDEIEWIHSSRPARRHTFALKVQGESMTPNFPHGAVIIVEPDEIVQHGRFVVAKRAQDTETTFKQYVQEDLGKAYLKPLNPQYPLLEIDKDCRIIGVVVEVTTRLF